MNQPTKIYLKGRTEVLKSEITFLLGLNQLLAAKDIGSFLGYPTIDYGEVSKGAYKLVIRFETNQTPPWRPNSNTWTPRPTYQIPNVDRTKIKWNTIKQACGGSNGYVWGHWRAYGKFDVGRMYVFGESQSACEERLLALASLSNSKLERVTYSDLRVVNNSIDRRIREPKRVYPAYFSVINHDYDKSRVIPPNLPPQPKVIRIPLYLDSEPIGTSEEITQVLNSQFNYDN